MATVTLVSDLVSTEKKVPIKIKHMVLSNGSMCKQIVKNTEFDNIEVLCTRSEIYNGLAVFFCFSSGERYKGGIYLGEFNDGVAE